MYVCMYVFMYVCIHVCHTYTHITYIHTYMHTHCSGQARQAGQARQGRLVAWRYVVAPPKGRQSRQGRQGRQVVAVDSTTEEDLSAYIHKYIN